MKCVNIKLWDILGCFHYILNAPRTAVYLTVTNMQDSHRVLTNSKFGLFYSNFLILTPTFSKVPIEKYGKTPIFSGKQHFYSYFQNPSENSVVRYFSLTWSLFNIGREPGIWSLTQANARLSILPAQKAWLSPDTSCITRN